LVVGRSFLMLRNLMLHNLMLHNLMLQGCTFGEDFPVNNVSDAPQQLLRCPGAGRGFAGTVDRGAPFLSVASSKAAAAKLPPGLVLRHANAISFPHESAPDLLSPEKAA
jgi:hypothetical protein